MEGEVMMEGCGDDGPGRKCWLEGEWCLRGAIGELQGCMLGLVGGAEGPWPLSDQTVSTFHLVYTTCTNTDKWLPSRVDCQTENTL